MARATAVSAAASTITNSETSAVQADDHAAGAQEVATKATFGWRC
jgi:hypothetical protein